MQRVRVLGKIVCPKCGRVGQLKVKPRSPRKYFYVDHYRTENHRDHLGSCYLGPVTRFIKILEVLQI